MSLKPTSGLVDKDEHRFVVQLIYKDEWIDAGWISFTNTLKPFERHKDRVNGVYGLVGFTEPDAAIEAAKAIQASYPDERLRVIDRNIIIEETFVREIK